MDREAFALSPIINVFIYIYKVDSIIILLNLIKINLVFQNFNFVIIVLKYLGEMLIKEFFFFFLLKK